jgi:hypothetical protein
MALSAKELTDRIDQAFGPAWKEIKKTDLPSGPKEDRLVLFAAVAHGVLGYLEEKQNEIFKTLSLSVSGGTSTKYDVTGADFNLGPD